jgi:hypothetical protein
MQKAFKLTPPSRLRMDEGARAIQERQRPVTNYTEIMASWDSQNHNVAMAEFVRAIRRDAWFSVSRDRTQFHRYLDKKQKAEFLRDIEKNGSISIHQQITSRAHSRTSFSADASCSSSPVRQRLRRANQVTSLGNTQIQRRMEEQRKPRRQHDKLVFPHGCSYSYGSFRKGSITQARDAISITTSTAVLRVLAPAKDFDEATDGRKSAIGGRMDSESSGWKPKRTRTRQIESEFFLIRYFKKGTIHLKWKDRELWAKFNKAASAGKLWLGQQH